MFTKLTIVYSTRAADLVFYNHLRDSCGVAGVQIIPIINDAGGSLTKSYNTAIKQAESDIVVFCHDDILFDTPNWGRKLLAIFNNNPDYGIIGLAGTDNLTDGCWWTNKANMFGIVNHSDHKRKWTSNFSQSLSGQIKDVVVVDGVFIAVNKKEIVQIFDESFKGFHFYDISFCFENFLAGQYIGVTTDIRITHFSIGVPNDEWFRNKKQFEEQYKDYLPQTI